MYTTTRWRIERGVNPDDTRRESWRYPNTPVNRDDTQTRLSIVTTPKHACQSWWHPNTPVNPDDTQTRLSILTTPKHVCQSWRHPNTPVNPDDTQTRLSILSTPKHACQFCCLSSKAVELPTPTDTPSPFHVYFYFRFVSPFSLNSSPISPSSSLFFLPCFSM